MNAHRYPTNSTRTLNDAMEFDHVIQVHADGTVTDGPAGIYAPEMEDDYDYDGGSFIYSHGASEREWSPMYGYSGQYGYSGPIMHASEFIGGRMADDILAEPGLYVVVIVPGGCDDSDDCTDGCTCEPEPAGWVVLRSV